MTPRLVLTTGEPAGVGPDLVVQCAMRSWPAELVILGCRQTLLARAQQLNVNLQLKPYTSGVDAVPHVAGEALIIDLPLPSPCVPGQLNAEHAAQVLAQLELAIDLCQSGECQGMVTAPLHKGVINDSGVPFSGHTEFLAAATESEQPVMLLCSDKLRVALATTHLPLRAVADAITSRSLERTLRPLERDLRSRFGIATPRITVLGLNPHAGESGHLGSEEMEVIAPVCAALRAEGLSIDGPIAGDTAFTEQYRSNTDAYLAMFHDQGLPVIKYAGFGGTVNVTLGLPIVRTSVDHGTALDLAGSGEASEASLSAAIDLGITLSSSAGFEKR